MSDPTPNVPNEGGNPTSEPTPAAGDTFQPITTQDALNRVIGERLERERARYADYADLKAKASTVDDLQRSTEEKVKEAEATIAGVPAKVTEALKAHLVGVHEISTEDAELFLTATDPETLLKQVQRLASRGSDSRKRHVVPGEGSSQSRPGSDSKREFLRGLTNQPT